MSQVKIPSWMMMIAECLESHLNSYESPLLEILPHPQVDRGICGNHEAFKTHLHHFCLFLCCAKEASRFGLENASTYTSETPVDDDDNDYDDDDGRLRRADVNAKVTSDIKEENAGNDVTFFSLPRVPLARLSLLAQPEDYRAWNSLKHPRLSMSRELKFGYFVLTKHPRSAETYCHLRYVTRRVRREGIVSTFSLCREGLTKCAEAAARYHGNYHAWDHRRFLISLLVEEREGDSGGSAEAGGILQNELDDVKAWQNTRVSDACPFKYRLFLVETRSAAKIAGVKFDFAEELSELNRLMSTFAGHETLWNHRLDLMKLARREDSAGFERLQTEDRRFLQGLEGKPKNDWEMTLLDRYTSSLARS